MQAVQAEAYLPGAKSMTARRVHRRGQRTDEGDFGMKHSSVEFKGGRMDYCCFGQGSRSLVILPGMSLGRVTGQVALLSQLYSLLCEDFTLYVFDRADDMPRGCSIEDMAEDTVSAMKALGLGKCCIFGCSQGGMMAQLMAINHPEAVDRLVIASSASRANPLLREVVGGLIGAAESGRLAELTDAMAEKMFTDEYLNKYGIREFYRENPPSPEDLDRFLVMAEALLSFDVYDRLGEIKAPALVIGVEGDGIVTGDASRELAERLGCELIMYEGYRHAVYDEAPDYKQHLLEFFTKD